MFEYSADNSTVQSTQKMRHGWSFKLLEYEIFPKSQ